MKYTTYTQNQFELLVHLLNQYKIEIGESHFSEAEIERLKVAIEAQQIEFFLATEDDQMIACCSLSKCFSTYNCSEMAIFEDFFVDKKFRGKGVARNLVQYSLHTARESGIKSIWVGCCDEDLQMYQSLGFDIKLGNLLATI